MFLDDPDFQKFSFLSATAPIRTVLSISLYIIFFRARDQLIYPYNTTGCAVDLYVLMSVLLERRWGKLF
jgi:hypothetical protein